MTRRLWKRASAHSWAAPSVYVRSASLHHKFAAFRRQRYSSLRSSIVPPETGTGGVQWKSRSGGGDTWSSTTQTSNGLMYLLSKSGTTTVFRPHREDLKRIAVNDLKERTNASAVVAGNEVLICTDEALWYFKGPQKKK